MNRFCKGVLSLLIVFLPGFTLAQSILLEGQVVDAEELTSLHFAHIFKNKSIIEVDPLHAEFLLKVNPQDTLVISHIGYKKYVFVVPEDASVRLDTTFFMMRDTTVLHEVKIHGFPTEKEFKQQIMATEGWTKELVYAQNNFARSQQLYKYGVVPKMDAMDNFKTFMKGPLPVVFFSSNSSMGLGMALKKAFTAQHFDFYPKKSETFNASSEFLKGLRITQQTQKEDSVNAHENIIVIGKEENE